MGCLAYIIRYRAGEGSCGVGILDGLSGLLWRGIISL